MIETTTHLRVGYTSIDGSSSADVAVRITTELTGSVFADLAEASHFFQSGSVGSDWRVEPATIESACSTFYDNPELFPPGSIAPDCALVMRRVPVTWHALPSLRATPVTVQKYTSEK